MKTIPTLNIGMGTILPTNAFVISDGDGDGEILVLNKEGKIIKFDIDRCKKAANSTSEELSFEVITFTKTFVGLLEEAAKTVDHLKKADGSSYGNAIRNLKIRG